MQKIQATISGFSATACTLYSALDAVTGMVFVSTLKAFDPARYQDCLLISSDPHIERDALFSAADLPQAIAAWQQLKTTPAHNGTPSRLHLGNKVQRADPNAAIEQDGWDVSGPRWRVNSSVTNAQIAVLATCLIARKHSAIGNVLTTTHTANAAITQILAGQVYLL